MTPFVEFRKTQTRLRFSLTLQLRGESEENSNFFLAYI